MAEVTYKDISKSFRSRKRESTAVRNLNLAVQDGELLVLVGPSGCGKTTTLRMTAGIESPDTGTIVIGGNVVNNVPPRNRDIAMVFQDHALYPHMTAFDNMAFGLKMRGIPRQERDERVKQVATCLELDSLLARRPDQLSGGERQRVAIGRAVARNPRLFLFDEPLSNLDAKLRAQTRSEIKLLHQRLETTMIYVTHDQLEAMTLGDRVAVMRDGAIEQLAPPLDVYERPCNRFVAAFIGSPDMNFLVGTIISADSRTTLKTPIGNVNVDCEFASRPAIQSEIVVGFRPESICFESQSTEAGNSPRALQTRATVSLIEPTGDQSIVRLTAGESVQLHAVVRSSKRLKIGDTCTISVAAGDIHMFRNDQRGDRIN